MKLILNLCIVSIFVVLGITMAKIDRFYSLKYKGYHHSQSEFQMALLSAILLAIGSMLGLGVIIHNLP